LATKPESDSGGVVTPANAVIGENGQPMTWVAFRVHELIGLPNYSNVTIGPVEQGRWVESTPEAIKLAYDEMAKQVEDILAVHREVVLNFIKRA
jgi:hypothetical protein